MRPGHARRGEPSRLLLEVEQPGQKQAHFEDLLRVVKLSEEDDTDPGGRTPTPVLRWATDLTSLSLSALL